MLVNELFDTVVFLCAVLVGASILMPIMHFVCNHVLGIEFSWD